MAESVGVDCCVSGGSWQYRSARCAVLKLVWLYRNVIYCLEVLFTFEICRKDVNVSKFLMSNLAFADLCLGLYLALIAAIDAHSMGEYFNYGYEWQYGTYLSTSIYNQNVDWKFIFCPHKPT